MSNLLQIEPSIFHKAKEHLRPTLQHLHLVIPLRFGEASDLTYFDLWNLTEIVSTFQEICDYIDETPSSELTTLQISFAPTVTVIFTYPNSIIVNYDRHGAIYEDEDLSVVLDNRAPSQYMSLLSEEDYSLLRKSFLDLVEKRNWTSITVPSQFPGSELLPSAETTDPCELDEEDLYQYLWKKKCDERKHAQQRKLEHLRESQWRFLE